MSNPDQPEPGCVLIYDGRCRMCSATKTALEHWPGSPHSVRYVPYHSQEAMALLGERYVPGQPEVAYLIEPGGHLAEGLASFLNLLPRLPGGGAVVFLLRLPLILHLATAAYKVMARNRYRWFGALP